MPIRKIAELTEPKVCHDPDHNVPMHWCPSPGIYEHTCPTCGNKIQFVVPSGGGLTA